MSYISEVCNAMKELCFSHLDSSKRKLAEWIYDHTTEYSLCVDIVSASKGDLIIVSKPYSYMEYWDNPKERFENTHPEKAYWESLLKEKGFQVQLEDLGYQEDSPGKEGYYFKVLAVS